MDIKYCKLHPRDMDSKKVDQDKPKLVLGCFVSSFLFLILADKLCCLNVVSWRTVQNSSKEQHG